MSLKVLVADHDHDVIKIITDILPLVFQDVEIDQAMDSNSVINKLKDTYDLIIVDFKIAEDDEKDIVAIIRESYPDMLDKTLLIVDSVDELLTNDNLNGLKYVTKPFSIDSLCEIVEQMCSN